MVELDALYEKVKYIRSVKEREHEQCASAKVFRRPDALYFEPVGKPSGGGGMGIPLPDKLEHDSGNKLIGLMLVQCLLRSEIDYVYDADRYKESKSLLELAGVKTSNAFNRNASLITVEYFVNRVKFSPMLHKGKSSLFGGNADTVFDLPVESSLEQLGEGVVKAFKLTGPMKG